MYCWYKHDVAASPVWATLSVGVTPPSRSFFLSFLLLLFFSNISKFQKCNGVSFACSVPPFTPVSISPYFPSVSPSSWIGKLEKEKGDKNAGEHQSLERITLRPPRSSQTKSGHENLVGQKGSLFVYLGMAARSKAGPISSSKRISGCSFHKKNRDITFGPGWRFRGGNINTFPFYPRVCTLILIPWILFFSNKRLGKISLLWCISLPFVVFTFERLYYYTARSA